MSRYIDYDAINYRHDKLHDKSDEFLNGVVYMAQRIEEAPSIDIVRCGECKYYYNKDPQQIPTANIMCSHMHPDDFCSYGEREGE